jgi:hypothetical protein
MSVQKLFFYIKDVDTLIEQAKKAGGTDLGIVITPGALAGEKPDLVVSYVTEELLKEVAAGTEHFTGSIAGCPYPPKC